MIDVVEITTSVGYNHLRKETLSEGETKNFVAKNILLNIKEVFEVYRGVPLERRFELMKFVNEESYHILDHVGYKYPQASSKGVSKRIKSQLPVINNQGSDEFDFLLNGDIHIEYRDDGDYSEDIMKILNRLITFSNEVFDASMRQ